MQGRWSMQDCFERERGRSYLAQNVIDCDRLSPCGNCFKRGKQSLCLYGTMEPSPPPASSKPAEPRGTWGMHLNPPSEMESDMSREHERNLLIHKFGYTTSNKHSIFGIFQKIDSSHSKSPGSSRAAQTSYEMPTGFKQRFRDLVRQLPSKTHIDIIVETFFNDVNWQYYVVDEKDFRRQMEAWERIPYVALRRGLYDLSPEIRTFPALIFQVLAQALLYQPHSGDERLASLKYSAGMSFYDVAVEFSETGAELLLILGKRDITMSTVQAGLLRASFLKSSGSVIEAWHTLGIAIRDAQEIGLHKDRVVSDKATPGSNVRALDDSGLRPRVWLVLHIWDLHMAVVLGRPITAHSHADTFPIPGECVGNHPPTPLSIILVGYYAAYRYFSVIHNLENSGAQLDEYSTVEETHTKILANIQSLPSWCRLQNPNLCFDNIRGCLWLPAARQGLTSLVHFVLLALHRPYIFSVAQSRTRALEAALVILQAQSRLFEMSGSQHHMTFNMVYASFDAIILIVAIYLLYPTENGEYLEECLQRIRWGVDTLSKIGKNNKMAASAHAVVLGLYRRLECCLASSSSTTSHSLRNGSTAITSDNPSPGFLTNLGLGGINSNPLPLDGQFNVLAPPHPIHDLFYRNLSAFETTSIEASPQNHAGAHCLPVDEWQRPGTYSDDSFWNFVNDLDLEP